MRRFSKEHRRKIGLALKGIKRGPFSLEWRKKLSEAGKGRVHSIEARKKMSISQMGKKNHNYGKSASEETRRKMSISQKGRKHSEETRMNISKALTGRIFSEEHKKNMSLAFKGRFVSEETRKKLSIAGTNRKHTEEEKRKIGIGNRGKIMSEEARKKISIARKGKTGRIHSKETKEKQRKWHVEHPNKKFKNTKIELKVEAELKKRGINYQKQEPLCKVAIVDFYLSDYKTVIQCDGCYWHGCPIHYPDKKIRQVNKRNRDINQDSILTQNGLKVYRFWEHEINESTEVCLDRLFLKK